MGEIDYLFTPSANAASKFSISKIKTAMLKRVVNGYFS